MRSNNLQNLLNTGETENHGSIDKMLESRIQKLNQLQKTNKDIITAKVEISKNPENTENEYGVFDKNTQSTLSYLSHIGYDEL